MTKAKMGRPQKHEEGSVNVNTYLPVSVAADLKRFTGFLTSQDGLRHGVSDVVIAALLAYRPLRDWKAKQKGTG